MNPRIPFTALTVLTTLIASHLAWAGLRGLAAPVYGEDDRLDLSGIQHRGMQQLADSTVLLTLKSHLNYQSETDTFLVTGPPVGKKRNLCETETAFVDQPAPGYCSGTLVGPDLVLTAGHCVTDQSECNMTAMVFGYSETVAGAHPAKFAANEVYNCQSIVARSEKPDWAVVRLEREVPNHFPLPVERGAVSVRTGDRVFAIGHPHGMPTKVTSGTVRDAVVGNGFHSNVDTFSGNSGSAVFNTDGRIVGVLVSGEDDYVEIELDGVKCNVIKRCTDTGCRGETATYIQHALGAIPGLLSNY